MWRAWAESGGPKAAATYGRRRALTYDDLPKEIKGVIKDYVAFTNASLRAAVKDYFWNKTACERRHGKMGTWDVGRVTDMSNLFACKADFDPARTGVEADMPSSRRASRSVDSTPRVTSTCVEVRLS